MFQVESPDYVAKSAIFQNLSVLHAIIITFLTLWNHFDRTSMAVSPPQHLRVCHTQLRCILWFMRSRSMDVSIIYDILCVVQIHLQPLDVFTVIIWIAPPPLL